MVQKWKPSKCSIYPQPEHDVFLAKTVQVNHAKFWDLGVSRLHMPVVRSRIGAASTKDFLSAPMVDKTS
eukprot:1159184-Pelagomonas_calceolata.AAC.1